MIWLGYKQVQISSIRMDVADVRRRTKAAHVADLASDIRAHGEEPIHAPTIRAKDKRLLCGRDRIAALMSLKAARVWVHLVDCNDVEAEELELSENIYRRADNRSELIAQLVALKERQLRETADLTQSSLGDTVTSSQCASNGRDGVKAEARRQVALAAGIQPASVKRAVQRARAAEDSAAGGSSTAPDSEPAVAAAEPALSPPSIDLLGVDDACARYASDTARADQEAIDKADQLLRQAQAELKKLAACTAHQNLHAQVHRVASLVRSARPAAICPWCKALPREVVGFVCNPCAGLGYVPQEVRDRAPKDLVTGAPMVAIDGRFHPYADVRDGKVKTATAAKAKRRISAQDADGNDIPLED